MTNIEKILSVFPTKTWFINLINDCHNELLPKDFVEILELLIDKCYDSKDLSSLNYELNIIYQMTWERINFGLFKDVPEIWRKIFAITCLLLVLVNLRCSIEYDTELFKRCLYYCDMSLMMGGELDKNLNLGSLIASKLHSLITNEDKILFEKHEFTINSSFDPLLNIPLEIQSNIQPLERIDSPSITEFLEILNKRSPVILTNVISDWPALSTNKWSVKFIKEACGYRTVPIEIGSSYAESNWTQKLMTINEFIDQYFHDDNGTNSKGYLAQHYLFSQIAELNNDIDIPDYCFINVNDDKNEIDINGWFGPSGTVSPLHEDPKHNLLCQIFGEKYVKLYLPDQTKYLYPNSSTMLKNTSKVDVLSPDLDLFPLFSNAKGFDGILKSGDVLFIPPKCWHFITSLSPSFSVNFWWNYKYNEKDVV